MESHSVWLPRNAVSRWKKKKFCSRLLVQRLIVLASSRHKSNWLGGWRRSQLCYPKMLQKPFLHHKLQAGQRPGDHIPVLSNDIDTIINITAEGSG